MLHAVIRSGHEALHFFGEVSLYNLQTLRVLARQSAGEALALRLRFEIAPADRDAFARYSEKWPQDLQRSGAEVEVAMTHRQ